MAQDNRKLVDVLKAELEFLKEAGYRRASGSSWRPQFVFEDSPSCLNQNRNAERRPCTECVLMQLVPKDRREEKGAAPAWLAGHANLAPHLLDQSVADGQT